MACMLCGHALANRSDNRLIAMLIHLSFKDLPDDGSKSRRRAFIVMYPKTKTRADVSITGTFRTEEWRLCFIGHLAMYLYYRFDVMVSSMGMGGVGGKREGSRCCSHNSRHLPLLFNLPPLLSHQKGEGEGFDFMDAESWRDKVLFAKTYHKTIIGSAHNSYTQERDGLLAAAREAKVNFGSKITHLFRALTVQVLNDKGVAPQDSGLPIKAMMGVAMTTADPNKRGVYDVPRTMVGFDADGSPDAQLVGLKGLVFPFLNEKLALLDANPEAFKGPMETSTVNMLRTLDKLREVVVQVGRAEWEGTSEASDTHDTKVTLTLYPPSCLHTIPRMPLFGKRGTRTSFSSSCRAASSPATSTRRGRGGCCGRRRRRRRRVRPRPRTWRQSRYT